MPIMNRKVINRHVPRALVSFYVTMHDLRLLVPFVIRISLAPTLLDERDEFQSTVGPDSGYQARLSIGT
jgi:hypothetical protein